MAKLPAIQYQRPTPRLVSPGRAGLQTKMQNIAAGVQAVRGVSQDVLQTFDKVMDSEAKLDAGRREQRAIRSYQRGMTDLLQSYHTDADKNPEDLVQDEQTLRGQVLSTARSNASGRVQRYLTPTLDRLNTRYQAYAIEQTVKLAESRQIMRLAEAQDDAVATVAGDPNLLDMQYELFNKQNDSSTLPAQVKRENNQRTATALVKTAVNSYAKNGDLEGLTNVMNTELFKQLQPEDQNLVTELVGKLETELYLDNNLVRRNELVAGGDLQLAFVSAEKDIGAMAGYTDYQKEQMVENVKFDYTEDHFSGLIARDSFQVALDELNSGKFDATLRPGKKAQYIAAATTGIGNATTANAVLANQQLADGVALTLATGDDTPANQAIAQAETLLPNLSAAQQDRLQLKIDQARIQVTAGQEVESWHGKTMTELAQIGRDITSPQSVNELIGRPNGAAELAALDWKRDQLTAIATQRVTDPGGYVMQQNSKITTLYNDLADQLMTTDVTDAAAVAGLNNQWAAAKAQMEAAQTALGLPEHQRRAVPNNYAPFALPMSNLMSEQTTRAEKMGSLQMLTTVFGKDASQVAVAAGAEPPVVAALSMAETGNPGGALVQLNGINKRQELLERGADAAFKKRAVITGNTNGYGVPYEAWGKQTAELQDMIFTQAIGYMDSADLTVNKPMVPDDIWRQAHRDIMGDTVRTFRGEWGQSTYTYTKDDGTEVSPAAMAQQIEYLRTHGIEGVTLYDSESNSITWSDAIERGWLVPVKDSTYRIDMRYVTGEEGWLTDEAGGMEPFIFDMKNVPMSNIVRESPLPDYQGYIQ